MVEQRIDQCAAGMAGRRMNDEPRLFVNNGNLRILIDYIDWDGFGIEVDRPGGRNSTLDGIAGFYPISGFSGLTIDKNALVVDQIGSQRTGTIRDVQGNGAIQPSACIGFAGNNGKGTVHRHAAGAGLIFRGIRNK
jgi:hypothetical protein